MLERVNSPCGMLTLSTRAHHFEVGLLNGLKLLQLLAINNW